MNWVNRRKIRRLLIFLFAVIPLAVMTVLFRKYEMQSVNGDYFSSLYLEV